MTSRLKQLLSKPRFFVALVAGLFLSGCTAAKTAPIHSVAPPLPQTMAASLERAETRMAVAAAVAPRITVLAWEPVPYAFGYRVRTGPARWKWTNSVDISANYTLFKSGIHYGISATDAIGRETPVTPYPTNYFGAYYVELYTDPALEQKVGEFRWLDWQAATNPATFLRIDSRMEKQE